MNRPRLLTLLACLLPTLVFAQGLTRLGEFKVSTTGGTALARATSASDAEGNFVVVWDNDGGDGSGLGIFGQRYNSAASPIGSEFRVNVSTTSNQDSPAVAMRPDGVFYVVWQSRHHTASTDLRDDVFMRRFSVRDPVASGNEIQVTTGPHNHQGQDIAINANGEFVVTWSEILDGGNYNIAAQRFSANGAPIGSRIPVTASTTGDQRGPSVAIDASGNFAIAWRSDTTGANGPTDVYVRRFINGGTTSTPLVRVSTFTANQQDSGSISMAPDGRFVIAWASIGDSGGVDTSGRAMLAKRFDMATGAIGEEFVVNQFTQGEQSNGSVTMRADGTFIVVYRSEGFDGSGNAVVARSFAADGTPLGDEFGVNTSTVGDQIPEYRATAAFDPDGNYSVTWVDRDLEIRADKFYLPNQGPPLSEFRVNTATTGDQALPSVAMNANGQAVVVWTDRSSGEYEITAQRYAATGLRVGGPIHVNAGDPNSALTQTEPTVAISDTGDFAVAWRTNSVDGLDRDVFVRAFNSDGTAKTDIVPVNTVTAGLQTGAEIAMAADGRFVLAWQSEGVDGDQTAIVAQRFDAAGNRIQQNFVVNAETAGTQDGAAVAIRSNGDFIVSWRTRTTTSADFDIRARQMKNFNATTVTFGPEVQVNGAQTGRQINGGIALSDSGNYFAVWQDETALDGNGVGVFGRRFGSDDHPQSGPFQVNSSAAGTQDAVNVAMNGSGAATVVWRSDHGGQSFDIHAQRYRATGPPFLAEGAETPINSYRTALQSVGAKAVAMDALGNYFVVWQSEGQDGSGATNGIYGAKVILSTPPRITTLNATGVGGTTATLNATVEANSKPVSVTFDYGLDPSFAPGTFETEQAEEGVFRGVAPESASARVTGLAKGQLYHVRAKAFFGTQAFVSSEITTFTAANAAPAAVDDTIFVPGSQVSFLPQGNDSDLDQAAGTLSAEVLTQPVVEGGAQAGTVQAVPGSNRLSFQANSVFVEEATFTYRVKDTDNAVSNTATVTLVRFGALRGTYQGLVTGTGGAGSLILTLNGTAGQVSGALIFQGVRYVIDGAFNEAGLLQDFIGTTGLGLFLAISTDGTITGAIKDLNGNVVADVTLDLIDGGSGEGFEPQTGQYTTFLDLPDSAASLAETNGGSATIATPEGTGFLALTIGSKKAKFPLRIAGELPDRTKLSAGGIGLSKRRYTIAQQLYKQGKDKFRGDIFGRPEFLGGVNNQLDTEFVWNKRPAASAAPAPNAGGGEELFATGFTNLRLLLKALPFMRSKQPLDFDDTASPNAKITFSKGGIDPAQFATLAVSANNQSTVVESNGLAPKLKIKARNPLFSGSFTHPDFPKPVKFQGIFVQGVEQRGRGVFIGTDDFGSGTQQGATGKVLLEKIVP